MGIHKYEILEVLLSELQHLEVQAGVCLVSYQGHTYTLTLTLTLAVLSYHNSTAGYL